MEKINKEKKEIVDFVKYLLVSDFEGYICFISGS